jgi:hypothetical protein
MTARLFTPFLRVNEKATARHEESIYTCVSLDFSLPENKEQDNQSKDREGRPFIRDNKISHFTLLAHIIHRTSIGYPMVHFPFVHLL